MFIAGLHQWKIRTEIVWLISRSLSCDAGFQFRASYNQQCSSLWQTPAIQKGRHFHSLKISNGSSNDSSNPVVEYSPARAKTRKESLLEGSLVIRNKYENERLNTSTGLRGPQHSDSPHDQDFATKPVYHIAAMPVRRRDAPQVSVIGEHSAGDVNHGRSDGGDNVMGKSDNLTDTTSFRSEQNCDENNGARDGSLVTLKSHSPNSTLRKKPWERVLRTSSDKSTYKATTTFRNVKEEAPESILIKPLRSQPSQATQNDDVHRRSSHFHQQPQTWEVQKRALLKKFGSAGWSPRKRLSPDVLENVRALNSQSPDKYTTAVLAEQFEVSPEAIRRILKSKWRPNEKEMASRRLRWDNRGKAIWSQMVEIGIKPPKKWRNMSVHKRGSEAAS